MAIVQMNHMMKSMKGRLRGSVFRQSKCGTTLYSNNWAKRGHTWRSYQERAIMGSISSQWKGLTSEEKASWGNSGGSLIYSNQNRANIMTPFYGKGSQFNAFCQINSILETQGKNKKPKTPPKFRHSVVDPWVYYTFLPDGTLQLSSAGAYNFLTMTIALWAGRFTPVWRKVKWNAEVNICILFFGWDESPLDLTSYYTNVFGTIPDEPGYVVLGYAWWDMILYNGFTKNGPKPLTSSVCAINGAPPYHE
jgi:hypothetical protein